MRLVFQGKSTVSLFSQSLVDSANNEPHTLPYTSSVARLWIFHCMKITLKTQEQYFLRGGGDIFHCPKWRNVSFKIIHLQGEEGRLLPQTFLVSAIDIIFVYKVNPSPFTGKLSRNRDGMKSKLHNSGERRSKSRDLITGRSCLLTKSKKHSRVTQVGNYRSR